MTPKNNWNGYNVYDGRDFQQDIRKLEAENAKLKEENKKAWDCGDKYRETAINYCQQRDKLEQKLKGFTKTLVLVKRSRDKLAEKLVGFIKARGLQGLTDYGNNGDELQAWKDWSERDDVKAGCPETKGVSGSEQE